MVGLLKDDFQRIPFSRFMQVCHLMSILSKFMDEFWAQSENWKW